MIYITFPLFCVRHLLVGYVQCVSTIKKKLSYTFIALLIVIALFIVS